MLLESLTLEKRKEPSLNKFSQDLLRSLNNLGRKKVGKLLNANNPDITRWIKGIGLPNSIAQKILINKIKDEYDKQKA